MPHINLPEGYPGISAGFTYRPETAKPMRDLAHVLLHEPNSLTPGERELIATFVSSRNDCYFCTTSHGAAAACHLGDASVVEQVKTDFMAAPLSPKLKALLVIAGEARLDAAAVPNVREHTENLDQDWFEQPAFGEEPPTPTMNIRRPSTAGRRAMITRKPVPAP